MHNLKADTYREFGRFSWWLVCKGAVARQAFRVVVTFRGCQAAARCRPALRWLLLTPARVVHHLASNAAGIEIPWQTHIGPGLALTHGRGIVVSAGAQVGPNVTLFHGVTLGRRDRIDPKGQRSTSYPVIEAEVWLGPHAIVVGGVTVGRGSRIAGGAYVHENVPPRSLVMGNPGVVIRQGVPPDVFNRSPLND